MNREAGNVYTIPANYTDSGRILGGLVSPRNALETLLMVFFLGYSEINFINIAVNEKIVICIFTILPVAVFGMIGINGDSLVQFMLRVISFVGKRKVIAYRRLGKYAQKK